MFLVVFRSRKCADMDAAAYAEDALMQKRGREVYYEDYTLFACDAPRTHQFKRTR